MTHYVLLKFKPDTDLDVVEARIRQTYNELNQALDFLTNPIVYRCCVERDSNADIMTIVQLDSPEHLQIYLTHPLHAQIAQDFKDAVTERTSFDHK